MKKAATGNDDSFVELVPGQLLRFDKGQEVCIDGCGFCGGHSVRETGVRNQFAMLQEFDGFRAGDGEWDDLVIFSMENKYRYVHAFQIFGKICF